MDIGCDEAVVGLADCVCAIRAEEVDGSVGENDGSAGKEGGEDMISSEG